MSDGLSDARRQAEVFRKIDHAIALIEEAFDLGGFDPVFGVSTRLVRALNAVFRKRGYELRQLVVTGKAS